VPPPNLRLQPSRRHDGSDWAIELCPPAPSCSGLRVLQMGDDVLAHQLHAAAHLVALQPAHARPAKQLGTAVTLLELGNLPDAGVAVAADNRARGLQLVPVYGGADAAQLLVDLVAL